MECTPEAEVDPQEIALKMDTYCVVVDPGQLTSYGQVRGCKVLDDFLTLSLSETGSEDLNLPQEVGFPLRMAPQALIAVKAGLRRVLTSGRRSALPRLYLQGIGR
ncbi:Imm10 family immunity protein [Micromonospora sp. NPDC051141]|uniref:Imm10 family immunity protein n=1 Tax=Micromonospora sp. NPDC051141 TaxID=3364284 RepID=UPI0037B0C3F4